MNTPSTKPKAIIYIRVSSDEQYEGTSPGFQRKECLRYCEQRGFDVVAEFEEPESAKDLSLNNRKELLRSIEFCRKHKNQIQAFVVLRVNRFARNTEDHFIIRKKLLSYGTTLHSVTEPIGNKPIEKLVETVAAASADYENAIRKQQCSDGMSEKINQGIYPWKPPLGYACGQFKKRGLKKTEADKPDTVRFRFIQQLLKKCLEEKIKSNVELAKLQKIDEIFSNKFYAGIIVNPFTGKEVEGKHERMITPEEFNQIQLIRKGKAPVIIKKKLKNHPHFPLTRDMKCVCSVGMSGSHPRGNGGVYSYYHCHNRDCPLYCKNIPADKVHSDFLAWLGGVTPKQEFLDLFREIVIDVWRNNTSLLEDAIKQQQKELEELRQKKFEYVELIRKGTISEDFGKEVIEQTDNEIAAKQITIRENHLDKLDIETAVSYATNFISDLPRTWMDLDIDAKKRFQKLVLPEGIVYDKNNGFGTAKLGFIYEMNQQLVAEKSDLVDPTGFEPVTSSLQMRRSTN